MYNNVGGIPRELKTTIPSYLYVLIKEERENGFYTIDLFVI